MPRILRNPNLGSAILTGPTQQPPILRGRELDPGGPFSQSHITVERDPMCKSVRWFSRDRPVTYLVAVRAVSVYNRGEVGHTSGLIVTSPPRRVGGCHGEAPPLLPLLIYVIRRLITHFPISEGWGFTVNNSPTPWRGGHGEARGVPRCAPPTPPGWGY